MKLLGKLAAGFFAVVVVAAVSAPLLLKKFLPPERVRALVVAQAQKALGREVRLGAVAYSLKGLSLEDLAVSERPDFKAGTFVSVKRFQVHAALLPLLKKTLVVDRVQADGLRVSVTRDSAGRFNFSDLLGASTATPSGAPSGGAAVSGQGLSLGVKAAAITEGALDYRDAVSGDELKISALAFKAKGIRLSGPFDAEFSARVKGRHGGKPLDASASLSGRFDLGGQDPAKVSVDLKKISMEYSGFTVKGTLKAKGMKDVNADAALTVSRGATEVAEIEWKGQSRAGGPLGVEADGKFSFKTPSLKAADFAEFGAPKTGVVPPLRGAGAASIKGEELTLKDFELKTPVGAVVLDGKIAGLAGAAPVPDVAATFDLDLPELRASELPVDGLPKGLRAPPAAVKGKARYKGDAVAVESLRVSVKQGFIDVAGSVAALKSGKPRADLEIATKLDVPELTASDLAFMTLPKGFVSPAFTVEGKVRVKGDDAQLDGVKLGGKAGTLALSGWVKGVATATPEPALDVVSKLSLPELKATDYPFLPLPAGLRLPSSRWDLDLFASRDEARIKSLRVVVGSNDVEIAAGKVTGLRSGKPSADILIKCRKFVLEELADLTPAIHEMEVKGSGFFAVSAVGTLEKIVLGGKLQFQTLAARVAGLKLEGFTGTASFDERRIDVPNLRGKLEDGELKLDLTVKNYAAKPDIDVEASLTEFDLGKFMAAKAKMDATRDANAEARGKPKPSDAPAKPLDLKGRFTVGRLIHPNFEAKEVRSQWALTDYTPDYKRLGGFAKFSVAQGGYLKDLGKAATGSKFVKVLLAPLLVIQKIGRVGGLQVFPNFDDVSYTELAGDYALSDGRMTLKDSHLNANVGDVVATGAIDLVSEKLDMTVNAVIGRTRTPIEIAVGGTFEQPKTRVKLEKLLADPAKKLLNSLFKAPQEAQEASRPVDQ